MKWRLVLAAAVLIAIYLFVDRAVDRWKIEHYRVTGTVYDAATKQPVSGAYVVAMYIFVRAFEGSTNYCWKSRGQVTGPDGRFEFPIEKLGYEVEVHAVLAGYYTKAESFPVDSGWDPGSRVFYEGRDVYLARQDPANPRPHYALGEQCSPEIKQAADSEAYVEYRRRVNEDSMRYFNKPSMS